MNDQKTSDLDEQNTNDMDVDASVKAAEEGAEPVQTEEVETLDISDDVTSESSPEDALEAAEIEIAKLKDAFLRAKAEEDNVRRRTEKEIANSRKFAVEGFSREMLNVYDSLKLACAIEVSEEAHEAIKSIHQGVEITLKQLNSAFAKFSIKEIAPEVGEKLDPNLHQAMSMVESEEVGSGHIINVIQSGFELHDRLLRPAMVVVAK